MHCRESNNKKCKKIEWKKNKEKKEKKRNKETPKRESNEKGTGKDTLMKAERKKEA